MTTLTITIADWQGHTTDEQILNAIKTLEYGIEDKKFNENKGTFTCNTYPINGMECEVKWKRQ